jgi:hypothetical protein
MKLESFMACEHWLVAIGVCLLSGCSSDNHAQPIDHPPSIGAGGASAGGGMSSSGAGGNVVTPSSGGSSTVVPSGSGGASNSTGGAAPGMGGGTVGPTTGGTSSVSSGGAPVDPGGAFDYDAQTVRLDADLVIPAGKTVRVGQGLTFNSASNVTIQVQGTLIVAGSAASPDHFMGTAAGPNSWKGIVVAAGGSLQMQHAQVGGATLGIHALKGSSYNIDYVTFDTSFKNLVLESDGKVDHSHFLATVPPTIAITTDVTIDDPNGTLTIIDASPTVTNSEFIGASAFTDLVRIGGNSAAVFDHGMFKAAHCGFHIFGATTSFTTVTNSVIDGMSYGVMAFTTKPTFKSNVFKGNTAADGGYCFGATQANAPIFDGNYFASGTANLDASCVQAGAASINAATMAIAGAGPVGL